MYGQKQLVYAASCPTSQVVVVTETSYGSAIAAVITGACVLAAAVITPLLSAHSSPAQSSLVEQIPTIAPKQDVCSGAERHWQSAESIHTRASYEEHIRLFPTCAYAGLAKIRIQQLAQIEEQATRESGPRVEERPLIIVRPRPAGTTILQSAPLNSSTDWGTYSDYPKPLDKSGIIRVSPAHPCVDRSSDSYNVYLCQIQADDSH